MNRNKEWTSRLMSNCLVIFSCTFIWGFCSDRWSWVLFWQSCYWFLSCRHCLQLYSTCSRPNFTDSGLALAIKFALSTDLILGIQPKAQWKTASTSRRGKWSCKYANPFFRTHSYSTLFVNKWYTVQSLGFMFYCVDVQYVILYKPKTEWMHCSQ